MTEPGRILYITYMGMTEPLLHSQGLSYLRGLCRKGYFIPILSFEKKDAWHSGEAMSRFKDQFHAEGIQWVPVRYHKHPYVFSTLFDMVVGGLIGFVLSKKKKIHMIHARGTVPAIIGLALKKCLGAKLLFDVRGLMAEEYIDGGLWKPKGWVYRAVSFLERRLLAEADAVIFLTTRILNFFKTNHPELFSDHRLLKVIPSCVDLKRFVIRKEKDALLLKRLGLEGRFVFIYVGSLGTWYLLEEMLDFFKVAKEVIPSASFLILTQVRTPGLERRLSERGIGPSDVLVASCPPQEVPRYLSLADAGVCLIRPCFSKLSSSPTKFGEYLACGLPAVINGSVGDMDVLVEQEKVGVVLRQFEREHYRAAAASLVKLIQEGGEALKERCRRVAEEHLALDKGIAEYETIYRGLSDSQTEEVL